MNMTLPETQILHWTDLESQYAELQAFPLNAGNTYSFLVRWSELCKTVGETGTFLQLAADLNTADQTAQEQLSHFHRVTQPAVSIADAGLRRKVLAVREPEIPGEANLVLRRMQTDESAYREENVQIVAEESDLVAEYHRITGSQMVDYQGEKKTTPQVVRHLQDPSRNVRESAWRAWQKSKIELAPQLDELFLKLLAARRKLAKNCGLESYRDFIWLKYHRYDYTPEDCYKLHESIELEVVPFATELLELHRRGLGVDRLLPWDFYWKAPVDPQGRPPIHPFETVAELEQGTERVFNALDPELGKQFGEIRNGFCDLGSRPNKMSHAYCAEFPKRGMPFVLENVVGSDQDVQVTLHEFGHAFHGYASMRSQQLVWNHFSATEFVEVPSQAMEVLAMPCLAKAKGGFYSDDELKRVRETQVSLVVHLLTWIGFMDSFQHWLYAEAPQEVKIEDMDKKAAELIARFMPQTDWSDFPAEIGKLWHYNHIFGSPFYYIEYGLSWLGALQLWQNSLVDPAKAMRRYRSALALGDSRSVPDLFNAAGTTFAFDRETVRKTVAFLRGQLAV
ncbi:MAG TPA: M3 family oligoendopeptidase [Chthoniobacterales bacterium]|nr:M3 family oligoendopeptidase [Chthoniobacterales bacterium]